MSKHKGRKIDNATKLRGKQAYKRSLETQYPNDGLDNQPSPEDLFVKVNNFARMFTNKRQNDNSKYIQFAVQAEGNTLVINMRLSDHYYPNTFPLMKADEKTSSNVRYSLCFRYGGEDDVINPNDNISDTKDGATNILYEIDGYHLYNIKDVELLKSAVQDLLINGKFELPFSPKSQRMLAPLSLSPQNAFKLKECINHIARKIITENKQYYTMNNTKNKVRLTESQLHNIIKESVKQVLSELDWKTYANAEKKALEKFNDAHSPYNYKDIDRYAKLYKKFRKARQNAFNKEYAYDEGNHGGSYKMKVDDEPMDTYPYMAYKDVHTQARTNDSGYEGPGHRLDYGFSNDNDYAQPIFNLNYRGDEYYDKMGKAGEYAKKGNKEIEDYRQGKYEYQKGKGWQKKDGLDESIRRAIRKVLR